MMTSFSHVTPDARFTFKADKGNVAVFLLLGNAKLGGKPLDVKAVLDDMGWAPVVDMLKYANHLTSCRHRGGHDCDCGLDEIRAAHKDDKAPSVVLQQRGRE